MILKNQNNDTRISETSIDGWVEIDRSELDAILISRKVVLTKAEQRDAVQSQIDALETKEKMNRFVRESLILIAEKEAAALGYTPDQLYMVNIGYKKMKDHDTQIVSLRTQMEAIV